MSIPEESIMAYADGEADPATCAAVEQAIKEDPSIALRVARHRALRARMQSAFRAAQGEAAARHLHAVDGMGAKVVQIDSARNQRLQQMQARRRWSWPEWGAMAATLAVGVLFGHMALAPSGPVSAEGGVLVAGGALAAALERQLAGQPAGEVAIGISFADRQGNYCRTFRMAASAGLACRQGGQWQIPLMVAAAAPRGEQGQAGAAMPAAVLEAVNARMAGKPFDAGQEKAAQALGWSAPRKQAGGSPPQAGDP